MSVLIKGMEMPKSCCACPLFKSNMSKQLFCKAFGAFDKSDYDKLPIERMKNCPLVEIKAPHGRLTDADALEQDAQKRMLICNKNDNQFQKPYEVMRAIALAPTIIPAEEG